MSSFNEAYKIVLQNEGGYANNPKDKGGETYAGIARNFFPDWEGWRIIDVKKLTTFLRTGIPNNATFSELKSLVDKFYLDRWNLFRLSEIKNQNLATLLFDYIINSGSVTPIKAIQEIVGVTVDGKIGTLTIEAINKGNAKEIFSKLLKHRSEHYKNIIAKDPTQKEFEETWNNRLQVFSSFSSNSSIVFLLIILLILWKKLI